VTYEYENLSEKIGLNDGDRINAMVKDDNGNIWFALQKELLCWDPNKHESTRYNNALGLDVSNFLPMVAQKDELGNLYFVTSDGILLLNPEKVGLPDDKIELVLYEVKVNDIALDLTEQDDLINGTSTLKWSDNYLEFYFNTNQLFELEPHQYEYRLQGLNNKWVDIGPANHVRFDNLQHGEYSLFFKVTNSFGVESEVLVIPFKIKKPFWLSIWFSLILIVFVGLIIYLIFQKRMRILHKRSEVLEKKVEERTSEVVEQKKEADQQRAEAEKQKEIVIEKQKEITDSIMYAKRIQDAIMPSEKVISEFLPESFVMYRPKDIVAGDFYWMEPLSQNEAILAVADCTGHGVPGAMVSVVCNNALNRSVREFNIKTPGELLDCTKELVIDQFEKSLDVDGLKKERVIKDGMDISLCLINKEAKTMFWAGANNPIWIIREGELIEIKGDKQPVGQFDPSTKFTTHEIEIQKGDRFYLFSDGYADQFGGEKGKKFKTSSLKKMILSIHLEPIKVQYQLLNDHFDKWKYDYEQLDDVCIIGFQV
jgi:serine phosphatase RsbU (regulator of sigma subunit)